MDITSLTNQAPQPVMALATAESQRTIQEVQAALVIAKQFPRNVKMCLDNIINSCSRVNLASQGLYTYSRGGTDITGPSIRLAEAIAQNWTNIDFGFRELSRGIDEKGVGYSEVQAIAWDMETNTRRQMFYRVRHWRDTRGGGYALTDERDIYEMVANHSQRRVRACILAVIPGDITDEAVKQCEVTMKANADTSPEAVSSLVKAFAEFDVSKAQIEDRIQRRVDAITPAQIVSLRKVFSSLRDGMSTPQDWFKDDGELNKSAIKGSSAVQDLTKPEPPAEEPKKEEATEPAKKEAKGKNPAKSDILADIRSEIEGRGITELQLESHLREVKAISVTASLATLTVTKLVQLRKDLDEICENIQKGGE